MSIFSNSVEKVMKIFMDYFFVYGSSFESFLKNWELHFKCARIRT